MLSGDRVRLRPVEEADLPLLVEWRNRPDVWLHFFNKFPLSDGGQCTWYKSLIEDRQRLLLIIEALDGRKALGTIGFDRIDPINQVAEYGNVLIAEESFRRRGLAGEATMLLLVYGFQRLNLNRVFLRVLVDNESAIDLYLKCGFKQEGRLRQAVYDEGRFKDILVMGLLRQEFISARACVAHGG